MPSRAPPRGGTRFGLPLGIRPETWGGSLADPKAGVLWRRSSMDQFLEMLRSAQGGQGMEALAKAYGLSMQQAQAVAEAMLPALADGFRHASQSPESMAYLMTLMTSGPYAALYTQPAAPAELTKVGSQALDAMFGSNEVSRAVANHVAASTGLGLALVRQMMPSYATLVVGGLARSLAASGALQQMLAAMLNRAVPAAKPAVPATGNPWIDAFMTFSGMGAAPRMMSTGNPWADAFAQTMLRYASPPAAARPVGNAWQEVVNAMSNTMAQASPVPAPRPVEKPKPLPFQDYFAQMFAQGFPPVFPGMGTERPAYSYPEYWLDMVTPSAPKEPAPEKPPAQIKGPAKPPAPPKGTNGTPDKN